MADNLVVGYGGVPLLPPLKLNIQPGKRWVLVGRNGAGKSTLLKTLLGLLPPVSGQVLRRPGASLSYLPQRHHVELTAPLRARDLVCEGLETGWSFLRPRQRSDGQELVQAALVRCGAESLSNRRYADLSEGQKQRVLLARAIVAEPAIILLDEPTSAMDLRAGQQTLDILEGLQRERGTAVLLISHHLSGALAFADCALFVDAEHQIVAQGSVEAVMANPTFHRHFGMLVEGACKEHDRHGP